MNIHDYFGAELLYRISKDDIDALLTLGNSNISNTTADSSINELTTNRLNMFADSDYPYLDDYVDFTINFLDTRPEFSLFKNNEIVKIDVTILIGIIGSFFISKSKLEYSNNLINEYEQLFLGKLCSDHDIKGYNIYVLYSSRKQYFLPLFDNNNLELYVNESTSLILNEFKSSKFETFDKNTALVLFPIQEQTKISLYLLTVFNSCISFFSATVQKLSDEKYKKALNTSFETQSKLFCPNCGKQISPVSKYCMYCGEYIEKIINDSNDIWNSGIPQYDDDDLMTPQDVYQFACEYLFQTELKENYEIVSTNANPDKMPAFILKKNGSLIFLFVEADVAPNIPVLTQEMKKKYINHASKYSAKILYASVSIGSHDAERFASSLALKKDGYYFRFEGFEPIIYI
ncbi:zinc ribbon domain-containing protein [Ruminococcus sp.]|uniref:zinc ribbon domain-containing protein n=1 Tax=Ruminococcus sp. TaxID=41978 RepID=UPI0025E2C30D|nr:zinc ribbon domain-containing protein [Ruminococcus sp.]